MNEPKEPDFENFRNEAATLSLAKSLLGVGIFHAMPAMFHLWLMAVIYHRRGELTADLWAWSAVSLLGLILFFCVGLFVCEPRRFPSPKVLWASCTIYLGGIVMRWAGRLLVGFWEALEKPGRMDFSFLFPWDLLLLLTLYGFAISVLLWRRSQV